MAMSGVKVNDACIKQWEALKSKKIKACNFKLSDNMKEIIVWNEFSRPFIYVISYNSLVNRYQLSRINYIFKMR